LKLCSLSLHKIPSPGDVGQRGGAPFFGVEMKLEVEMDTAMLATVVQRAFHACLSESYSTERQAMTAHIKALLIGPEVEELIRVEIGAQLPRVVHDVVAEMLDAEIRRQTRAIRKKGLGTLFDNRVETTPVATRTCERCGRQTRISTAGCDHCDLADQ